MTSLLTVLFYFATKILKSSILIAWKWLIPPFDIYWMSKIRICSYFSNFTSFWRHYDVIWRHFCHFDVIFRKMKSMLHQQLIPILNIFWVCKIRIFNHFSNLTSSWLHYNVIWRHYCYFTSFKKKIKHATLTYIKFEK